MPPCTTTGTCTGKTANRRWKRFLSTPAPGMRSKEEEPMKRSTERILTTHVGSLVRPPDLQEMIRARESGNPYDHEALAARVRSAVAEAVHKQVECGIDIVSDGEQGKLGFNTYTNQRLAGFEW